MYKNIIFLYKVRGKYLAKSISKNDFFWNLKDVKFQVIGNVADTSNCAKVLFSAGCRITSRGDVILEWSAKQPESNQPQGFATWFICFFPIQSKL